MDYTMQKNRERLQRPLLNDVIKRVPHGTLFLYVNGLSYKRWNNAEQQYKQR